MGWLFKRKANPSVTLDLSKFTGPLTVAKEPENGLATKPAPLNGPLLPRFDDLDREFDEQWDQWLNEALHLQRFRNQIGDQLCFQYIFHPGAEV